jgi:hypothetical protein
MSAYVCYGSRLACVVPSGFSCTRDELPAELERVAGPVVGQLHAVEVYSSRAGAVANAAAYNGGEPPAIVYRHA